MDSRDNPSWVHEELRSRGFTGDDVVAAFSNSQIRSFVASLRVCTRNKDLVRGASSCEKGLAFKMLRCSSDHVCKMR